MKKMENIIGIPIESENGLESKVSSHFGKAPYYLLFNEPQNTFKIIKNTSNHFGGKEHPPVVLKNAGVHTVIVGNIGDHAKGILDKFNIQVYAGAKNSVKETLDLYHNDKLHLASDDECKEHDSHTHSHNQ